MCKAAYYHLYAISKIRHCPCPSDIAAGFRQRGVVWHYGGTRDQIVDGAKFSSETDRKAAKTPAYYTGKLHWVPVR